MRLDAVVDLLYLLGLDLGVVLAPVLVLVPGSGLEMVLVPVPLARLDLLHAIQAR